jgi:hypothetical protein
MTVNCGLTSAIFFNHSWQAPHGFNTVNSFKTYINYKKAIPAYIEWVDDPVLIFKKKNATEKS